MRKQLDLELVGETIRAIILSTIVIGIIYLIASHLLPESANAALKYFCIFALIYKVGFDVHIYFSCTGNLLVWEILKFVVAGALFVFFLVGAFRNGISLQQGLPDYLDAIFWFP